MELRVLPQLSPQTWTYGNNFDLCRHVIDNYTFLFMVGACERMHVNSEPNDQFWCAWGWKPETLTPVIMPNDVTYDHRIRALSKNDSIEKGMQETDLRMLLSTETREEPGPASQVSFLPPTGRCPPMSNSRMQRHALSELDVRFIHLTFRLLSESPP
ncbi:hypothetical protein VNO77_15342 [Canavalia gladiata]|uniref:Uncharacterized protein n=1 Tax=Canavalia gladiata TaxID=3824 RepID=A0AAN9QR65_CANGL